MITRRDTLALATGAAGAALAGISPVRAQNVSMTELVQPGPLGDSWLGEQNAKVVIVEYASLTCSHCASFHRETWPELKKRYVDTGQARFALREFPFDPFSTAGFMLARADNSARYYPITDLLFETQKSWTSAPKPLDALRQTMKQAGFSQEKFDAILRDQTLYAGVLAVKERAEKMFKVESTPTFFVNGQRVVGAVKLEELEKIIKPMLGA